MLTNISPHLHQSRDTRKGKGCGRREGKGGVADSCYSSKQSFLNQVVPSIKMVKPIQTSQNLHWGECFYNYIHYAVQSYQTSLYTRCTSGHSSRVMGPRSSSLSFFSSFSFAFPPFSLQADNNTPLSIAQGFFTSLIDFFSVFLASLIGP